MLELPTTVLLVEDNDGDAVLVEDELRHAVRAGSVVRAIRLAEAIELAREQEPDVMLLDLSLPDSHGLATVIRAVDALPLVPIVVLTGTDDLALAKRSLQAGAQDYLVKGGFQADGLIRAIRYAIERHRTMRMLREANEELARANELKDDFVSIASHELRTPVTVIRAAVQTFLERWSELGDEQRVAIMEALRKQSDRLVTLVDDLLVLARVDRGGLEQRGGEVDLRDVVAAAVEASRIDADMVRTGGPRLTVRVDREHLERMLVNLLDNAAKYGAPPVEVDVVQGRDVVEVRVRDHGPGVDPAIHSRLFDRFVRSEAPEVRREAGTGLGLAIVRALGTAMGASVTHEPPEGGGARFVIQLPVTEVGPEPVGELSARGSQVAR